jgi:hypothetical protein
MKTWYLKLDVNNVILDAIEYPYEGYTEVQLDEAQLPAGINGGWYTWTGTTYVENLSKKPKTQMEELALLQEQQDATSSAVDFLLMNSI